MDWIATHPWAYPALETLHIVGIALLVGSLVVFELRVWGVQPALELQGLARLALSTVLVGFVLAAGSGAVMLFSQWDELRSNRALWLKMGVIAACGINAAVFHGRGGLRRLDSWARAQTALSLGLWLVVVASGRFIAYV